MNQFWISDGCIKISYHTLRTVARCPYEFELVNIQGRKPVFETRRFLIANIIDLSLSDWINTGFMVDGLVSIVSNRYVRYTEDNYIRWKSLSDKEEQRKLAVEVATNLERQMREAGMCRQGAASTQDRLNTRFENVILTGRPDLVYHDTLELYDLKTTENNVWMDWDQLVYYSMVLSWQKGKRFKKIGFLVPMMSNPIQIKEGLEEDMASEDDGDTRPFQGAWLKTVDKIRKVADTIKSGNFPAVVGDHCYMCLSKDNCKYFKSSLNKPVQFVQIGGKVKVSL